MKLRRRLFHAGILIVVFFVSLLFFEKVINSNTAETTTVMEQATFPLVYMVCEDTRLNCLHGYAQEMPVQNVRDTVTPLAGERSVDIEIDAFSSSIDSISYKIISTDGEEELENTKVTRINKDGNHLRATLELKSKILMNQEYDLELNLVAGGRNIYYYTRVIMKDGLYTKDYLDFVNSFYQNCLEKKNLNSVAASMEPDVTLVNANLASVNINSSVDEVSWGSLNPQIYCEPTPSVKDINQNTANITMDYMISTSINDKMEYYHVTEYYRVRHTDTRVFLLNFERSTSQLLVSDDTVLEEKGINLGITDWNVEYVMNDKSSIVAFVQENELWTYNISNGNLARVFSFYQKDEIDPRDFYGQHSINILKVFANGDLYFTVSGYMNRGKREGQSGVALYFYDSENGCIDEKCFIDSRESSPILDRNLNALSYLSDDEDSYFLMVGETVYEVRISLNMVTPIIEGLRENCYAQSENGKYFAWLEENKAYDSKKVCLMNLDTKNIVRFRCSDQERIRIEGFVGESLIYGVANTGQIDITETGNELFGMNHVYIVDSEGNIQKDYNGTDFFVTAVEVNDRMVTLHRSKYNNEGRLEPITDDHIVDNVKEQGEKIGVSSKMISDRKQTEMILMVGKNLKDSIPQVIRSRIVLQKDDRTLLISTNKPKESLYYVYAGGKLDSIYPNANTAIMRADEKFGIVVNYDQRYIWERGNKASQAIHSADCVDPVMLQGYGTKAELEKATGKTVLDLSGCTLDEVLYFVDKGIPVLGLSRSGPVAITGYNELNTLQLYPGAEESIYMGIMDSTAFFEENGNRFFVVLEK